MTATASTDSVLLESHGAVRVLTFNRPEVLNVLNAEVQLGLPGYLEAVAADKEARALVITGAGHAFSAGGDKALIRSIAKGTFTDVDALARSSRATLTYVLTLPIPVIAAVRGPAVGMAAGWVALCDFVVMGAEGYLCDPNVAFGAAPHIECQLLWPRMSSPAVARELLMTGRKVGAEEALQLGLVNKTCPDGEELATALALAEELIARPAAGLAAVRRAFNEPLLAELIGLIDDAQKTRELPNQAWLDKLGS